MQALRNKSATHGATNTGVATDVSRKPSSCSHPHGSTRLAKSQPSQYERAQRSTKVPNAKDRPHLRGDCVYLGQVACGTLRAGVFSRRFDSTKNTLLWGTHLSYRVDLLRLLEREGAHTLRAKDTATRETYAVSLTDFLREAQPFESARCGDQLALELTRWQRRLPAGGPVQLDLFSGVMP